ncbi:MAG: nucleoside triphosphate pyrophosphohydrolase [Gammaproteobacteria bacterium]|nr:nucleoside triphosphate pyrophosphohydrolase [Gammaproteobacteria bacterium]
MQRLLEIMAALRSPRGGCPWDLEQTFATIAPYTIEEAYEVADAIARDDMDDLVDELGDLLFQVVFHARMAEERGAFDFADVAAAICDKMERRHPHVFDGARVDDAAAQTRAWEAHKAAERSARRGAEPAGVLDDLGRGRPALQRARELQARAARHGFDWRAAGDVVAKLREELDELEAALAARAATGGDAAAAGRELGDLLFTCVNLARHLALDSEAVLTAANLRFERRFRHVERRLAARGRTLDEATLEEMDALWEEAKQLAE